MSERDRLDQLTESLLAAERGHPGLSEERRARLSARLAQSIGRPDVRLAPHGVSSDQASHRPDLEGLPRRASLTAEVGGASFNRRPRALLTNFLRASLAGAALSTPWAIVAGMSVATLAGVTAWTVYRAAEPTSPMPPSIAPAPRPRPFPALRPLPEPQRGEAPPLTASPGTRSPSAPPAPIVQPPPPIPPTVNTLAPSFRTVAPPEVTLPPPGEKPEERLLESARAALSAGNASGALGYLDEHRLRFPSSQFLEEREILAMEAQLLAGRTGAARQSAQTFLANHPDSLLVPRAQAILNPTGEHDRSAPTTQQGGTP